MVPCSICQPRNERLRPSHLWLLATIIMQIQTLGNKVNEIYTDFGQRVGMLVYNIDAFLPDSRASLYAAELPGEKGIESIQMVFGPLDAGTCQNSREALLVDVDCVFDQSEIDVGNLEYIEGKIALEDTCPISVSVSPKFKLGVLAMKTYRTRLEITSDRAFK